MPGTGIERTPTPEWGTLEAFEPVVASITDRQYRLYWLGPQFASEGVLFAGPYVDGIGSEIGAEALGFSYAAELDDGGGHLIVLLMSAAEWERTRERYEKPPIEGVLYSSLSVAGFPARLLEYPKPGQPTVSAGSTLIIELDDTVIVATAPSLGSPAPGMPDRNPLVEPANLVAVMEQLRPYPS